MKKKPKNSFAIVLSGRRAVALLFVASLVFSDVAVFAQSGRTPKPNAAPAQDTQETQEPKIPNDQLASLVAPIALYPDPLLSQTLVASTYPLEIIQLQQWLDKNKNLKDKALTDAVSKQTWDPSIQAMAALPDVVKRLADDITWTTDLGNAFLAQQADVMDAVQRMRQKAQGTGALKSNSQQKVETEVVENKTVIVVEQANPQVVYVPSHNPTVIYGPPVYPYPPIYYPPSTGAVIAASAISFGVGIAIGAAWGGGGWGWGCGWGHNDVNINVNNTFNRNTNISGGNRINNIQGGNRTNVGGGKWQHNPQHRGGAPYGDRGTANRFGGTSRGDSTQNRQRAAQGGAGNRAGVSDRSSGIGSGGGRDLGGNRDNMGGDRIGSRDISRGSGQRSDSFGGSGSIGGGAARGRSATGASSMGGGGFGGRGGGGGGGRGGGGGGRGGGGRR